MVRPLGDLRPERADCRTPNLRPVLEKRYVWVCFEEGNWELLYKNNVLFQAGPAVVMMRQWQCNDLAYSVRVHGMAMIVTSNEFVDKCPAARPKLHGGERLHRARAGAALRRRGVRRRGVRPCRPGRLKAGGERKAGIARGARYQPRRQPKGGLVFRCHRAAAVCRRAGSLACMAMESLLLMLWRLFCFRGLAVSLGAKCGMFWGLWRGASASPHSLVAFRGGAVGVKKTVRCMNR